MTNRKSIKDFFEPMPDMDSIEVSDEFMEEVRQGIKEAEEIAPSFAQLIEQTTEQKKAGVLDVENADGSMTSFYVIPPHCDDDSLSAIVEHMTGTEES